jgi:hypothetical protein
MIWDIRMTESEIAANIESPSVECFAECPHFESVSGRCGHDLKQSLLTHFRNHPDTTCPIYNKWRGEEMYRLARRMNSK